MEIKGIINGHEYVDLGLPSGLLWATCNVGANSPEEYGNYYAWGETSPKEIYSLSNYKFFNGTSITKYTKADRIKTLKASDDAATANWGDLWRTPTKEDFEELKNNCKWEDCSIEIVPDKKWVFGYRIIGQNGNSIFLPKAGLFNGNNNDNEKYVCNYWSSSLHTGLTYSSSAPRCHSAWRLIIDSAGEYPFIINACFAPFGVPVRPVAPSNKGTNKGCYVATAVYGSYNCPEVWTLRRFRDNTLDATWYGRTFIRTYYAISPTLVKWFGETSWFKRFWRRPLDRLVNSLCKRGVESTPYDDKY